MKKIFFSATIFLVFLMACAYQESPTITDTQSPRIIIKEVSKSGVVGSKKEYFFKTSYVYPFFETSYVYSDTTKGCIENQAFPFAPKVFLIRDGQKIVLVGPRIGPPEFNVNEIREFNLPPGEHFLHIERWQHISVYGGWKKILKTEVVKVSVAQFSKSSNWNRWKNNYYGWNVIIYDDHSVVRSGYR